MKKIYISSLCILISMFFISCGGGGGSSSSSSSVSTYGLSGTVPGTLIEALCKDGSYYSTNSVDDGTSNHPFELELPLDVDCKLIMTTNEDDSDSDYFHAGWQFIWEFRQNIELIGSAYAVFSNTNTSTYWKKPLDTVRVTVVPAD